MAENVQNVTLEILKGIHADLSSFRADAMERFERIEKTLREQRRGAAGMLVMMQATVGAFDERVKDIEERVAALETRKQ